MDIEYLELCELKDMRSPDTPAAHAITVYSSRAEAEESKRSYERTSGNRARVVQHDFKVSGYQVTIHVLVMYAGRYRAALEAD